MADRNILNNYPGNAHPWLHRIVVLDVGGAKWIWATPDRAVQVGDLSAVTFKTVARNSNFPMEIGNVYAFDPESDRKLRQLKNKAHLMSSVMGVIPAAVNAVADAISLYADVALKSFNMELSGPVRSDPPRMEIGGGTAQVHPAAGVWTCAECVLLLDHDAWLQIAYHSERVRASDVNGQAGISIEHSVICTTLSTAMCYDISNVLDLAFVEQMSRRLLMIELAVKRNPQAPDFKGLEMIVANGYEAAGGVTTLDFDKYFAETQKNDAVIMKPLRMLREEPQSDVRTMKGKDPQGKGKGKEE